MKKLLSLFTAAMLLMAAMSGCSSTDPDLREPDDDNEGAFTIVYVDPEEEDCGYCEECDWCLDVEKPPSQSSRSTTEDESDERFSMRPNYKWGAVPFTADCEYGDPPFKYRYLADELYFYGHSPGSNNVTFGSDYISINLSLFTPHTGVRYWLQEIRAEGDLLVIRILRLDNGSGAAVAGHWEANAQVKRSEAPGVNSYQIVVKSIQRNPDKLTVTIRDYYMHRVIDKDFEPSEFGPLVKEIEYDERVGNERRYIYLTVKSSDPYRTKERLLALPFVYHVEWLQQLRKDPGNDNENYEVYINSEYDDKFDREEFELSDFDEVTNAIRFYYFHSSIIIFARITLILHPSDLSASENIANLKEYLAQNAPFIESMNGELYHANNSRTIYPYRKK
ncbi:MAG: hypothetical protein FWH14_03595 [Oscillospiraceae bacterium]|nr:hypothetical protein [Oscillospiraceae bacterium]